MYQSLETLKILTFWKITKDKDVRLLDVNFKDGKKYTKKEIEALETLWLRLFDEYFTLRDRQDSKRNLIKSFDELKLREKINQVKNAIEFLETLKNQIGFISNDDIIKYEQECYNNLKKIDNRIKPLFFDGIDANLVNLSKVLKSFINKYNVAFKEQDKVIKNEVSNVYDIVASVESWLERNLDIDNMSVSRWLAYEKQVEQKQKSQSNGAG